MNNLPEFTYNIAAKFTYFQKLKFLEIYKNIDKISGYYSSDCYEKDQKFVICFEKEFKYKIIDMNVIVFAISFFNKNFKKIQDCLYTKINITDISKYTNLEIYKKQPYDDKYLFLGFYKRTFTINKNKFYEFSDYNKNTTCINSMEYDRLYIIYTEPPKISSIMKFEIKYHPYNLFIQKNIENYLDENTIMYFRNNIYAT